jgi:hypothetical protein
MCWICDLESSGVLFYISMAVVWLGSGRCGHGFAYFYLP